MRVIGAKNPKTLIAPEDDNTLQFLPKLLPIFALKIQRIDILIFLGWILRILDRSVRTLAEPLRMLRHIRMIRRALKLDVQGDFDVKFLSFRYEKLEIRQRSQLCMNGLVAAFFRADGPGATDIVGAGRERIILPFAKCVADRVNRRKIEDIETHSSDVGQTVYTVAQCAVRPRRTREGTGKQLVPSAKARFGALDVDPQLLTIIDCPATV